MRFVLFCLARSQVCGCFVQVLCVDARIVRFVLHECECCALCFVGVK